MISPATKQFPGLQVELSRIEQEFREIWKKSTDSSNENAVIKAGTLNLVIPFNTPERLSTILRLVPEIIAHHPGRIIPVFINPQNPTDQIKASISAFCRPPRYDGKQICCELVNLETGPAGEKHLPGTLLPLLLPDLPVFLWSPNNLVLSSPALQKFHKNVDRIVLHSPESVLSTTALLELTGAILETARMSKISDMHWAALTGWREAIAGFFDGVKGGKNLQNIRAVHIRYGGEGVSFHSYLVAGWLAFLLHWKISGAASPRREYNFITPEGKPVVIHLEKSLAEIPENGLDAITLPVLHENGSELVFHAEKINDHIIKTSTHQDQQLLATNDVPVSLVDEAHLLCNELDYLHEDSVYTGAVQSVHTMLNAGVNGKNETY